MRLAERTIVALADLICGDSHISPYRSGPQLCAFFNEYGFNDVYSYGGGFPTRKTFAAERIRQRNSTPAIRAMIGTLFDGHAWIDYDKPPNAALELLNKHFRFDGFEAVFDGQAARIRDLKGAQVEVESPYKASAEVTHLFIDEQIAKCDRKIAESDFDGAITNSRSLLEAVLISIERERDPTAPVYGGDLVKLYRRVQKALNLDPARTDIAEPLKQLLSGLTSIVNGLSALRNKMSDAHAASYRPAKHHAKLAVNAAKTMADFLFETNSYQAQRATAKPPNASPKPPSEKAL